LARERRSDTSGERTAEQRERAREERERRRLAKAGATQPALVAPPLPPPLEEPPSVDQGSPVVPVASGPPTLEPSQSDMPEEVPPRYPLPLPATASGSPLLASSPRNRRTGMPAPHGLHLQRPHLRRPHVPRWRGRAARAGALLALVIVLGALAVGAVLLVRRSERPQTPPLPTVVKVVIPEGYTRTQIATLAHADGLRGSYLLASKRSAGLRPARYGAPAGTPNLEGFLFPATYEMDAGAPAARLVSEQLAAFRENFGEAETHRAKALGITPYQLLIVASIVEREAGISRDRRLVAAVIYNRLRQDMTLGIDATLRYALHDFTHPLTEAELSSGSPYNTRTHKGLPPTPISNPGAAAIKAAARPAKVSYLYYVAGADGCGEQVFSTSYAEFEKNAAAYRQALKKNDGHVPRCKKG
jgi:cell division protein YceG involved in septum cleavage